MKGRGDMTHSITFRRYPDGCYAVVMGRRRGPCAHSCVVALARYRRSGLIASAASGR